MCVYSHNLIKWTVLIVRIIMLLGFSQFAITLKNRSQIVTAKTPEDQPL